MASPGGAALAAVHSWRSSWLSSSAAGDTDADRADSSSFLSDDATLRRYLVARGSPDAACSALAATAAWRRGPPAYLSRGASSLGCPACARDAGAHCFLAIGATAAGHALVYASPARARTNATTVTVRHMVHTLEHAFAVLTARGREAAAAAAPTAASAVAAAAASPAADSAPPPPPGSRWTWLVDFRGFGLSHAMQGRTSLSTLSTFSAHMPERLEAVVLINPPGIFDALLALLKPVLDARTAAKVHVVRPAGAGAALRASLAACLAPHGVADDAALDWLAAALQRDAVPANLPDTAPLGALARALALDHSRAAAEPVEA